MCIQGCRTFLWGGHGMPEYDNVGRCLCDCDDDDWSALNILALPSCVPQKAHMAFGWTGLIVSTAALSHAAYHLRRQLRFHELHQSASTSPAERCRRELHIVVIAVSTLHIIYFGMVLGDKLAHSIALLGAVQILISISAAILVTRMWIYTNDTVLMRKSPEVLRISQWLETPAGRRVAYGLVSISPVCAVVLDLTNHPEMAITTIAAGIIVLVLGMPVVFGVCGRSLIRAIDESVRQQLQKQQSLSVKNGLGHEGLHSTHSNLLRARKKVQTVVLAAFGICGKVAGLLLFAVCTKYGTAAPLLLFLFPMEIVPGLWSILHIQIHAGRTKLDSVGDGRTSHLPNLYSFYQNSTWRSRHQQTHETRVVPMEVSSSCMSKVETVDSGQ